MREIRWKGDKYKIIDSYKGLREKELKDDILIDNKKNVERKREGNFEVKRDKVKNKL